MKKVIFAALILIAITFWRIHSLQQTIPSEFGDQITLSSVTFDSRCLFTQTHLNRRIVKHLQDTHPGNVVNENNYEQYLPVTNKSIVALPEPRMWIHIPKTAGLSIGKMITHSDSFAFHLWGTADPAEEILLLERNHVYGFSPPFFSTFFASIIEILVL